MLYSSLSQLLAADHAQEFQGRSGGLLAQSPALADSRRAKHNSPEKVGRVCELLQAVFTAAGLGVGVGVGGEWGTSLLKRVWAQGKHHQHPL